MWNEIDAKAQEFFFSPPSPLPNRLSNLGLLCQAHRLGCCLLGESQRFGSSCSILHTFYGLAVLFCGLIAS